MTTTFPNGILSLEFGLGRFGHAGEQIAASAKESRVRLILILIFLAGKFLAPVPMLFLAVFTSTVQAFIFTLLSMMYFAGSMEHAH